MSKKNKTELAVGNVVCGISNDKDIIIDQDMMRGEITEIDGDLIEIRVDKHKHRMFIGEKFKVSPECIMKIGSGDSFLAGDIVCFKDSQTEYEIVKLAYGNCEFRNCETDMVEMLDMGSLLSISHSERLEVGDYVRAGYKADGQYAVTTASGMDFARVVAVEGSIIRIKCFKDLDDVGTFPVRRDYFIKISKNTIDKF